MSVNNSMDVNRPKAITISDIARMANVGVATVSRVLNDSPKVSARTAAKVRRILKQTHYRPTYAARALAQGRTDTVELLYNTRATKLSQDPVLLSVLDAAQNEVQRAGYRLFFSALKTDFTELPSGLLQAMDHRMADGAMLVSYKMTQSALEALQGHPVVLLDHDGRGMISSVTNNHYRPMREAVEMLAARGHRNIAFFWRGPEENDHNDAERYRGYCDQMQAQGLRRRPEWEIALPELPARLDGILAGDPRPTAIITTNTEQLPRLFRGLEAHGLEVPRGLSLLTVDSAPEASAALTGMARPASCYYLRWDSIVHTATEELLAVMGGNRMVRNVELPVPYAEHGTVGAAPAG